MPLYEVQQYELHVTTYQVEADSVAAAVNKVLNGEVDAPDNATEYLELADAYGMSAEDPPENAELAEALHQLDHRIKEYIPTIRSAVQLA